VTAVTPEDAILFLEKDMAEVECHPFVLGNVAVLSRPRAESEGPNQDAAALIPFDEGSGILVVADGVGGMRGGAEASGIAVHELTAALENAAQSGTRLRNAVINGIEAANREIRILGIGAATTLALAEINGTCFRPYHIGDSEIMVVGQRGRLKLQTVSHSPTGYGVESGLIDAHEAIDHEDRHYVSNTIGGPDMRIEIGSEVELAPCDTVLIASDGLFDNLHADEIVEILRAGPLDGAVQAMADLCQRRMDRPSNGHPSKPDDLTIVALRLN